MNRLQNSENVRQVMGFPLNEGLTVVDRPAALREVSHNWVLYGTRVVKYTQISRP